MNDKFVTINSVEGLNAMPPGSVVQGADGDVYKRGASWWTVTFSSGSWPSSDIVLPATVLAPKPAEPVGDVVERVARAIFNAEKGHGLALDATYDNALHVDQSLRRRMARAALSALPPSDAERKLAAVRELCDATAALCQSPVPTDDDPMGQGAWAARREVVDALNALLDGEATS